MKLNLGCGWRNFGPDWIHIDGGNYDHLDYNDITELEFQDNSVDLVYSSHVIEYFDRDEIISVLTEWKRVLKPDGIMRLAVPNFKALSQLYINGQIQLSNILGPLYGKMKMGDDFIYHKTVYDYTSLCQLLLSIDMKTPIWYDWRDTEHSEFDDHSQAYVPHMDKDNGTLTSLNIQAVK